MPTRIRRRHPPLWAPIVMCPAHNWRPCMHIGCLQNGHISLQHYSNYFSNTRKQGNASACALLIILTSCYTILVTATSPVVDTLSRACPAGCACFCSNCPYGLASNVHNFSVNSQQMYEHSAMCCEGRVRRSYRLSSHIFDTNNSCRATNTPLANPRRLSACDDC
jgi:hypothetical protein